MKIFIDSASLDEIEKACSSGVVKGVTTNPSLIKKAVDALKEEGMDMQTYIKKILETAGKNRPVSLEVIGLTEEDMFKQARKLYDMFNNIAGNVVIKIPINPSLDESSGREFDGLRVIKKLSHKGIPVNCTLVMTPEQALLAAKAGAAYVSPFAGRIDDYLRKKAGIEFKKENYYPAEGLDKDKESITINEKIADAGIVSGVDLVSKIVKIFHNYNLNTEVIAASVRNSQQVREMALAGADIATIPFSVLKSMLSHEKTYEGVKKFNQDIVDEYADLFK
jgi:transaldolase